MISYFIQTGTNFINSIIYPEESCSFMQFIYHFSGVGLCTYGLSKLHGMVAYNFLPESRYFLMHVIVNSLIICACIDDVFLFLENPSAKMFCNSPTECSNQLPNIMTMALHNYHMLFYKMKRIDLVHHIPAFFGGIINALYPTSSLQNFTFFFIMGLPGLIDYFILFMMKYGFVSKKKEKIVNCFLNVWIRSPGLIVSSFSIFQSLLMHRERFGSVFHIIAAVIIMCHNFWNGQYFMSLAIESEVLYRNIEI